MKNIIQVCCLLGCVGFAVLPVAICSAAPFPAPVDGVVTIDTAANVVYDEALPATANTLVKKGKGTATLTVASPDFAPEGGGGGGKSLLRTALSRFRTRARLACPKTP